MIEIVYVPNPLSWSANQPMTSASRKNAKSIFMWATNFYDPVRSIMDVVNNEWVLKNLFKMTWNHSKYQKQVYGFSGYDEVDTPVFAPHTCRATFGSVTVPLDKRFLAWS